MMMCGGGAVKVQQYCVFPLDVEGHRMVLIDTCHSKARTRQRSIAQPMTTDVM